jgi:hypothetical protein
MRQDPLYLSGARFACAYSQSHGVTECVASLRVLSYREPALYVAGICDALLDILQGDKVPSLRRVA